MSYQLGSTDPPAPRDQRSRGDPEDEHAEAGGGTRLLGRGILSAALVLVVMAAFAGGIWFAHATDKRQQGGEANAVPLLRADPHPLKVRPAAPGGMVIPDQNMLVYGERHDTVEHLLPPPETPLPRPAPPAPKQSAAPPPVAAATAAIGPAPAPAAPAAKRPAPAPTLPAEVPIPPPAAAPPRAAVATPAPATAGGGVRLQLGAVRSPDAARREWQHLKKANADLLGNVAGFAVRVDLGAKGIYYRIETAPFADLAAAMRLCDALKQRGAACILDR
jgi:hypothetical protein